MNEEQNEKQNEETKKQLALEVIRRLKKEYPDTHCTLAYQDAWQLLVSRRWRHLLLRR